MALEEYSEHHIYVCGFDDTEEKAHLGSDHVDRMSSYEKAHGLGPGHNWKGEWNYIQNLIDNGKIKHIRDKGMTCQ